MGFKRYLYWNDAIHGFASYGFNFNYNISTNCFMASKLYLWTIMGNLIEKAFYTKAN